MLDVVAVIISHNHGDMVRRAITTFLHTSRGIQSAVLLVDNAGEDGLQEWAASTDARIRVFTNEKPQGFAHNNNMAMRAAPPSRYFLLLNPDIECTPYLAESLLKFMDESPDVGIAGPRLLNLDGSRQMSARSFSTPTSVLIRGLHLDGLLRNGDATRRYLMADLGDSVSSEVDWVSGALMVVRRDALRDVGLMDEGYFMYSEDQDWCCRMWRAGWRVCYVPQARAVHVHMREGMKKPWSRAARYQVVSALRMFRKFSWRLSRES